MICLTETALCAVQGDDETYSLTFTLDGTVPLDLTGSTITFVVVSSKSTADTDALITKTVTTFDDAVNGKATITLTNVDTNLPLGTYFYRMKLTNNLAKIKTIMKGTLAIEWAK